jgi:hypothetical protein
MTDFQYLEKIYYIENRKLHLRNISKQTDILSSTFEFQQETEYSHFYIDLLAHENKIILMTFDREEVQYHINLMKFDKQLKLIEENLGIEASLHDSIQKINTDHNERSVLAKYAEIPSIVNYRSAVYETARLYCYDKYDDCLVVIYGKGKSICHRLKMWKLIDNIWTLYKSMKIKHLFPYDLYLNLNVIKCSRNHIMTETDSEHGEQITLIDKNDFKIVDRFHGFNVMFFDDYVDWLEENLEYLKGVDVLGRLNVSLLKIILLYVS